MNWALSLELWKKDHSSNIINKNRPDESVIKQGESGDCLYVVETGELRCYKKFVYKLLKLRRKILKRN